MRWSWTSPLLIATHNSGKIREFQTLFSPYGLEIHSADQYGLSEPEEAGASFEENALLKARLAHEATGLPTLADDSGLCVEALEGLPGLHSARWAGPLKDFGHAMHRIEEALKAQGCLSPAQRGCFFKAVLAFISPTGEEALYSGRVDGVFIWPPRGTQGFGYDSAFLPHGLNQTFGELSASQKHGIPADGSEALSHRARAFQHLARDWFGSFSFSDPSTPLPTGIYRHYKGHVYEVIGVATHSETLESLVVYRALYGERALWVRPLSMFLENVIIEGKEIKRFEWIPA